MVGPFQDFQATNVIKNRNTKLISNIPLQWGHYSLCLRCWNYHHVRALVNYCIIFKFVAAPIFFKFLGLCSDILGHKQAESAHQLFWSHQLFWFVRFALNDSVFFCWHEYKGRPIQAIKSLSTGRLGERDSTFSLRSKHLNDFPFSLLRFLPYAVWVLVSGVTCAMADLFSGVRILSWFLNMYKRFRRTSVNQCSNWKYLFPLDLPQQCQFPRKVL